MSEGREHKPAQGDGVAGAEVAPSVDRASPSALLHRNADQPVRDPMFYVRHERARAAADATRTARNVPFRKAKGAPASAVSMPKGSGAELGAETRARMEQRLGADLGDVRVHTGGDSAQAADALGARAFTVGRDVHFGAGEFSPGTREGDRLLAHELTHTVQARNGAAVQRKAHDDEHGDAEHDHGVEVSHPDDAAEKEADATADRVTDSLHSDAGAGQQEAPTQKAPPIAAKLLGGWRGRIQQIMRAAKNSLTPVPGKNSGIQSNPSKTSAPTPDSRAPAPPSPKATSGNPQPGADTEVWAAYANTLPGDLGAAALAIREPDEQAIFKGLLDPEKLTFAKLSSKEARLEFGGLDNWTRSKVRVVSLEPDQFSLYMSFAGPVRTLWRDLTPDERRDMCATNRAEIPRLLANPASLNTWRQHRNVQLLKTKPQLAAQLALPGGDSPEKIVEAMSVGQAAERLRRILVDTSFAQEETKIQFIHAVWESVKAGEEPFKAMKSKQSAFALKGKEAKGHPEFKSIPVMKAIATKAIATYGEMNRSVLRRVLESAPPNHPGIPRLPDGAINYAAVMSKLGDGSWKRQVLGPLYVTYAKQSGVTNKDAEYTIKGGATPAAYWLASPAGKTLIDRKLTTAEVMGKLAIDESPDYQMGFIVVELDDTTKAEWAAKMAHLTRPTAIDALDFDQFAINPDANSCLGITSGGMPEVVVRAVPLSRTNIVRQP